MKNRLAQYVTVFALVFLIFPAESRAMRFCTDQEIAALDIDGPNSRLTGDFGPYLQNVGPAYALIEWNRAAPKNDTLTVTQGSQSITSRLVMPSTHQVVGLCDLKPGERYTYELNGGPSHSFEAMPAANSRSFRFAVVGDSGELGKEQAAVLAQIKKYDPQFIIMPGDLAYPSGSYEDFQIHFLQAFAPTMATIPVFPAMGNHDVRKDDGQAYLDIFSLPSNNPEQTERYYSFDAGPIHFVVLDSSQPKRLRDPESKQLQWLEADLSATQQPWKVVVFHHPPYSSGTFRGSDTKIRKAIEPILAKHEVDLVLNGHSHTYQRSHPQQGVVYVVTGGGGGVLRGIYMRRPFSAQAVGKRFHFVGFTLSDNSLTLNAIDQDGQVIDTWQKVKLK